MKIKLIRLLVRTRKTNEHIEFGQRITFLHGPVSTGKSTVARLIDYCLGGDLERTPAIQQEFVAAELSLMLGKYDCKIERSAGEGQAVRISWSSMDGEIGSVNAPLVAQAEPLVNGEAYNLSDMIFYLCGITPIKVRQRSRDPDSPMIRLSIRDIWWYCYLDQLHLDSSFFHLDEPFRGRKSQDAMRFFTGLHSERLSQIDDELMRTVEIQQTKRESVLQIRQFMNRFELGSEAEIIGKLEDAERSLSASETRKKELDRARSTQTHPTDALRTDLRGLSSEIEQVRLALAESRETVAEQKSLRAELIMAKTKAQRASQAGTILDEVEYQRCPECGSDISSRPHSSHHCHLCGSSNSPDSGKSAAELEEIRRDFNERIDQIADSIARREREENRMENLLTKLRQRKTALDKQLQEELARYDSAFVESIRGAEREIATLTERIRSLKHLQQMPRAINSLEEEAGALQGKIDRLKSESAEERIRLRSADDNISAIAEEFKQTMLEVSFPGVSANDEIIIDPRNWRPTVVHGDQSWSFWDTGSGGKKTLFNVCYALAIHAVAMKRRLPVPSILIIDSPTKNISEDENPELVRSLYAEIYKLAGIKAAAGIQFLLIDSDLVPPSEDQDGFAERRMAGETDSPSLISYYDGP